MKANMAPFLSLLGASNVLYVVPVYQRRYTWDEEDCRVLWDDIMRAGKQRKPHFIGSVLHIPEGESTITGTKRHLLIDGQQRMTTVSLLMEAFIEYLEKNPERAGFLTEVKVPALRKIYLYNDDDYNGDARYKLSLSQEDRATLHSIVASTALPKDSSQRLTDNLESFRTWIRGKAFDPEILWTGLSNLQIIDTELMPGIDDAQLIFESMNSKGKPLSPTDLIRNYILMSLPEKEQAYLFETYWRPLEDTFKSAQNGEDEFNSFMWYWLWIKVPERKPAEDDVYAEFKHYKQDDYDGTTEELLQELLRFARHYADMFLGNESDPSLKVAFDNIVGLKVKPIRPLMMVLYDQVDAQSIDKDTFKRLCDVFESYLFRRSVVGRFTTGLNNYFAGVYRDIGAQSDIETYVMAMLLTHDRTMTAYFPTDEHFFEELPTRDCYNRFSKRGYLLERLENAYHPKQPINVGMEYQIEHVMPQTIDDKVEWQEMLGENWQTIHDEYCNNIGNLTLTGANSELSNNPFNDKLNDPQYGFKKSPYVLNGYIKEQTEWTQEQIIERAEELGKIALTIWRYPKVDPQVVESFKPKKEKRAQNDWTMEERHAAFLKGGKCYDLFEELVERISEEHPDWEQYVMKYYVGYRTGRRKLRLALMERTSGKGRIALCLPKSIDDLDDPKDLCVDKRAAQGIGPGCPTLVNYTRDSELDDIMALIDQC